VPRGVYLVQLEAGRDRIAHKLVLARE